MRPLRDPPSCGGRTSAEQRRSVEAQEDEGRTTMTRERTNKPASGSDNKAYQLLFSDHRRKAPKTVNFDSDDGHEAFKHVEHETAGRAVELWLDNHLLCGLIRDEDGVWSLSPARMPQTG